MERAHQIEVAAGIQPYDQDNKYTDQESKAEALLLDDNAKSTSSECDIESLEKTLTHSDDEGALDLIDPVFNSDLISVFERPNISAGTSYEDGEIKSVIESVQQEEADSLRAKALLSKLRKLHDIVAKQFPEPAQHQDDAVNISN